MNEQYFNTQQSENTLGREEALFTHKKTWFSRMKLGKPVQIGRIPVLIALDAFVAEKLMWEAKEQKFCEYRDTGYFRRL